MSAHRIYFSLESKSGEHKARWHLAVCAPPSGNNKIDLDELTEVVSGNLIKYANNKPFIRQMLEKFVQESWDEYWDFYCKFHGIGEE